MRSEISLRIDGRSGFEDEHFHAAFGEFFCGHAAGSARADDDCVVDLLPLQLSPQLSDGWYRSERIIRLVELKGKIHAQLQISRQSDLKSKCGSSVAEVQ